MSNNDNNTNKGKNDGENNDELNYTYNTLDGITYAQRKANSAICEIIWPGASNLSKFLLDILYYHPDDEKEYNGDDGDTIWIDKYLKTKNIPKYGTDPKVLHSLLLNLKYILQSSTSSSPLCVIELGAGIGYTGIKIATCAPSRVLLTDLDLAMKLLQKNIDLNKESFLLDNDCVQKHILDWTKVNDDIAHLLLNKLYQSDSSNESSNNAFKYNKPIILLAADCIYFSSLHLPFEQVLQSILSKAPIGSMCVIASEKRWKRDNTFFVNFGKKTKTKDCSLQCFCVQENVDFVIDDDLKDDDDCCNVGNGKKVISRIHIVQWLPINKK